MDMLAEVKARPERYEQRWHDAGYSDTQVAAALDAVATVGLTITEGIHEPLRLHIGGVELQPELPPRTLA